MSAASGESPLVHGRNVIRLEIEGLQRVLEALDESFDRSIALIEARLAGGGKIVVSGVGKNRHIAAKISATLTSTGAPSVVLDTEQAMHGDLGVVGGADVVLALSYSGESEELLKLLPVLRNLGVPVVALTSGPETSLAQQSDVMISVAVDREACPFNMAPTVSTTATLAVGDAIAMTLLERREFTSEDYARLHPGGAIGRTLLLHVEDFMRSGDRLARVEAGQAVHEAIVAMTRARSGSAGVVDSDGRLLGIFTDGDLRRRIADSPDLLHVPVSEAMTKDPVTALVGQKAVDVLQIYAEYEIDDLPVVDTEGRLVGIVDIQQLPKLKIF